MSDLAQVKLGPIKLAPGVTRLNAIFYLFAHAMLLCLLSFIGMVQPYLLTEILHVDRAEQGTITGSLVSVQVITSLVLVLPFGAFADRFGRKIFMISAASFMTVALFLYPLVGALIYLYLLRFVFGLGAVSFTASAQALRMDLPDNDSRGRFNVAISLVAVGVSALFVGFLGARMPGWLIERGLSAAEAGRYTFWLAAALGATALVAILIGFRQDRPPAGEKQSLAEHCHYVLRSLREVFAYARINPRYRLRLLVAPILQCDSMILASFLSLWIITAGHDQGLSSAQAMLIVGTLAWVMNAGDLSSSIIAGFIADKVDRLKMLVFCIALSALAFSAPVWVTDVTGYLLVAVVLCMALAEGASTTTASALVGEVTPAHLRGITASFASWIGKISSMLVALISGLLFDRIGYAAPFLLLSGMGVAWLLTVFILYARKGLNTNLQANPL